MCSSDLEATMRDDGIPAQETEQEMLRQIGFSYWPETAETFVRDFLAKLDR